ncbi:hypothetical protein ACFL1I_04965 [Candidatus Omnitrophota bacterium]
MRFFKKHNKGQALVLAYVVLIFLTVLIAAFLHRAVTENRLSQRQRWTQEVIYLAEGGIEDAVSQFAQDIANFAVAADIPIWPAQPDPVPDPPIPHTTTYTSFNNATVDSLITRMEAVDRIENIESGAVAYTRNYEVVATAQHPSEPSIAVTLHQVVGRRLIPAFQHAVFYDRDLEILPGPDMDFAGRIHSNEDIYIGTNNTLTVDSMYLRSAGEIFNERKNDGSSMPGTVDIRVTAPEGDPPTYQAMDGLDSNSPTWTAESQTRWQGTVMSAVHGVTRLSVPQVQSIQPGGFYASQANVVITNDTISQGGTDLVAGVDVPADTVTSHTDFYNNRENRNIKMTNLDLQKLAGYATPAEYAAGTPSFPNHLPNNGLLYATRDDAGGGFQPGVRLINGVEIVQNPVADRDGLTVVSNDPVYIQGDYNTEAKKPAAVIGDALNILSSAWDNDSDSNLHVNDRDAAITTINTAFVAGIDDTSGGNYNGGLENYPRMHERWTGMDLNIRGAFLALWNSQVATGEWQYGNPQYTAPIRNWDYDLDFNDPAHLPPFTPWAVEMNRVAWWQQ